MHWDKIKAPQEGTIWHQASGLNPNLNFAELESLFQVSRCLKRRCLCIAPVHAGLLSSHEHLALTVSDCLCNLKAVYTGMHVLMMHAD